MCFRFLVVAVLVLGCSLPSARAGVLNPTTRALLAEKCPAATIADELTLIQCATSVIRKNCQHQIYAHWSFAGINETGRQGLRTVLWHYEQCLKRSDTS